MCLVVRGLLRVVKHKHGVANIISFGTFCIKHIQKNLIVACYLWVVHRSGSNLCGGSSSSSSAFVYQGTCDFHAVKADYEARVWIHSFICHLVQNQSGKKMRTQHCTEEFCIKSLRDHY